MPLTLTLREGDDVYVGTRQVFMRQVVNTKETTIQADTGWFTIDAEKWMELFPGCKVRGAPLRNKPHTSRLQFDAPEFKILRGTSYRNKFFTPGENQ
jgi:hypothetical protein